MKNEDFVWLPDHADLHSPTEDRPRRTPKTVPLLIHEMAKKQYLQEMDEAYRLWHIERRRSIKRYILYMWLITFFLVTSPYFIWATFLTDSLNMDDMTVLHPVMTPATAIFMAGLFSFVTIKICKKDNLLLKCVIAAVIGGILGVTVRVFQIILMVLFLIIIIMPVAYIMDLLHLL